MENIFKAIILHSRIQYPTRNFLLAIGIMLLTAKITIPAFANDTGKQFGFSTSYFVCLKNSGNVTENILNCNKVEQEYQNKRLETANLTLLKNMFPADQRTEKQGEQYWIKEREDTCEEVKNSENSGNINYSICFLYETAKQASLQESYVKQTKKRFGRL